MTKKFSGSGGLFGGGGPTETDDNLFSTDIVEVVLGVSEGPIKGLKDGAKSFLLDDTPLKDVAGNNNFDSFELVIRKGSALGEKIVSRMGGFASSTSVGTQLASNVPVVRQGTHTSIDYMDVRLVVNRLYRQNDDGTFDHTGKVKIEYKKTSSPTWLPVSTLSVSPPPTESSTLNTDTYTEIKVNERKIASPGDRPIYRQPEAPAPLSNENGALWLDSNDNDKPYTLNVSTWNAIPGAVWNGTYWVWSERSSWGDDKQTYLFRSASVPPDNKEQGDYWIDTETNVIYFFNGSSWIVAGTSLAPGNFGSSGVTLLDGEVSITGKTQNSTVKEFRFPITNIADDTYQLRVTKTSPNNTSEDFFDVTWESFQEVTAKPMQFPNLATAQMTARASEQFSSIPQFSGIYEGRVIRVPVNYNPETKVYTGVWDGTWKLAYTTNPAFIVNDLVSNDTYGLNSYYPVELNKWDVYEAAQWCDQRTVDGIPRFTFNQLIDTPRNCREAIDYICGTFGGRFFDDGNGFASIRIDKPQNSAGIFAKENVVDGIFSYSFTEATTRYNDITVTFKNPALNYQEDRRRVFNQSHIDKYGRIPLNFIAVGCNSSAEAIIRGRYKLVTGLAETTIINFKTNRQGLYYNPYDIILVVDEDMNSGLSGRVKAVTGAKTFSLRDPVFLEAGFNYKVIFQLPDGTDKNNFLVVERELPPGTTGTLSTITTLTNLPALPENAVFLLSTVTAEKDPRPYRITRIDEIDGDPDNVEIQAIEVNRLKWDFVDGEIEDYEDPEEYLLGTGNRTQPVADLRIRAFNTLSGSGQIHNVLLDWDPSPTKTTSGYKVFVSKDNGPMAMLVETRLLSFEYNNLQPGEYLFTVIAVSSISGAMSESIPVTIEHRFIGDIKDPTRVTDLRMVDEASPPIYARRSPTFTWSAITVPQHKDYVVRIYDPVLGIVMAQHYVRENQFTYDYQTNAADHSGVAVRSFDISVASRDQHGGISPFNIIMATNPPPAVTSPIIVGGVSSAVISWVTTGITDYLGAKIWIGTTPDFPLNDLYLKYNGGGNNFTFVGFPDTVYYIRMALFDNFNQTEFVVSSPALFTVTGVDLEDIGAGFSEPIGYISGEGGANLAARLAAIERNVEDIAFSAMGEGLSSWHRSDATIRTIEKQGAKFQEEINVISDETENVASRLTTFEAEMESELADTAARILTEETARATADDAMASIVNILTSTVNTNNTAVNARIATEETTRATTDTALSNTLNTLTATVTTNNNTITSRVATEETARSTADTGLANSISTVSVVANNAAAAVVTERNARISADSAMATDITEVAVNLGTYSASGRAGFQVSAVPGGATARYSVVVRAGTGSSFMEAGMYFDIIGGVTRAAIKANSFYLLNDSGGYLSAPFYITGGVTYINNALIKDLTADKIMVTSLEAISATLGNVTIHGSLVVAGTITTVKVGGNAITVSNGFVDNASIDVSFGATVTASTVALVMTAGVAYIDFSCKSTSWTSNFPENTYRLYRDATLLVEKKFQVDDQEGERDVVIQYRDVVGDGLYTYSVTIQNNGTSCGHMNRFMRVLNMKR